MIPGGGYGFGRALCSNGYGVGVGVQPIYGGGGSGEHHHHHHHRHHDRIGSAGGNWIESKWNRWDQEVWKKHHWSRKAMEAPKPKKLKKRWENNEFDKLKPFLKKK